MKLYHYWRSSASYRVRAALNLKQLKYDQVAVDLLKGEQCKHEYTTLNPAQSVPSLEVENGHVITQSLTIMEYIDSVWNTKPQLLPSKPLKRAQVQAIAHAVAMDIHPMNNLRVASQLRQGFGATEEHVKNWMQHWMVSGFERIEAMLPSGNMFAFEKGPSIADLCIVSQVYNARRWGVEMKPFPRISRIEQQCLKIPEILSAHPDNQPEATQQQ